MRAIVKRPCVVCERTNYIYLKRIVEEGVICSEECERLWDYRFQLKIVVLKKEAGKR